MNTKPNAAKLHSHNGELLTLRQLAELAGCSLIAMKCRLQRGLTPEQAVAGGANHVRAYLHPLGDEMLTVAELARRAGCSTVAMGDRLKRVSPEKAVAGGKRMNGSGNHGPRKLKEPKLKPAKPGRPKVQRLDSEAPVICNVKPVVCPSGKDHRFTVDKPTPYFSLLQIGSYAPGESWAAKVYG